MIGHEACDRRITALEAEIARLTAERDEARYCAEDMRSAYYGVANPTYSPRRFPWEAS